MKCNSPLSSKGQQCRKTARQQCICFTGEQCQNNKDLNDKSSRSISNNQQKTLLTATNLLPAVLYVLWIRLYKHYLTAASVLVQRCKVAVSWRLTDRSPSNHAIHTNFHPIEVEANPQSPPVSQHTHRHAPVHTMEEGKLCARPHTLSVRPRAAVATM